MPPIPDRAFALLLDLDGSLVEIAPAPDLIHVPASLIDHLAQLHHQLHGAIACVSGRSYADLSTWLGNAGIDLIGSHGAEVLQAAKPSPQWTQWARQCRQHLLARWAGVLVETKPHGLAIHWRQCPEAEPEIRNWVARHQCLWPAHHCVEGKAVIEIRPDNCTKAHAVHRLMQQAPYAGRLPVYLGDDITDLDAFEAVRALDGWAVAVGEKVAHAADHCLHNPASARAWLHGLLQSAQSVSPAGRD